ncbi:MAG: Ni/Fe hydrogenase subunit alpha [Thermoplasmata archaeon]|nr:MAG: Ni/Fe hydrogenase subunit alpha [Thermoplasmata archaeon]
MESGTNETGTGGKRQVTIDPITRLEGHGKIEIFLDETGEVEDAYFQVPELRGFERFCLGRPGEELPRITPRICGVCPTAHHFASTKALDAAYGTKPTETAEKLRRLIYAGYYFYDHTLNFYFLAGPDFVMGPSAPKAERNILGVIDKVGLEVAGQVIKYRAIGQNIIEMLGGKATHPVCGLPGGVSKALSPEDRDTIAEWAEGAVEFAQFSLSVFNDIVLKNEDYVNLITNDEWALKTYYMGLVNDANQPDYYDGDIRVVDPEGKEFARFQPADYLDHIEEHVEPWSYIKFPYLKNVGWKGFVDGPDSGIYRVAPLARLNVAEGMSTPEANSHFKEMYSTLGGGPVHHTLAMHWARLIELLNAAEMLQDLVADPGITGSDIRAKLGKPGEGVGVDEACRGTLFHHYKLDDNGMVEKVNLIVATVNNSASICMSVKNAARSVIHEGNVDDGILNTVEMAFRAYDPCFACATHTLPGNMPLQVDLRRKDGSLVQSFSRTNKKEV